MPDFDLRALVRDEVATSNEPEPAVLWQRIVEAIADTDLRSALVQVGPVLVTEEVRRVRNEAITQEAANVSARPGRWKRHGAIYKGLLASRVKTGAGWKFLADCTRDDLLFAADSRRSLAASVLATADFYQRLADELGSSGAATVRDLPPDIWGSAA